MRPWLEVARLKERGAFGKRVHDLTAKLNHQKITKPIMDVFSGVRRFSQTPPGRPSQIGRSDGTAPFTSCASARESSSEEETCPTQRNMASL